MIRAVSSGLLFFGLLKGGIIGISARAKGGHQKPVQILQPECELRYIEIVPEFVFT